ncbi:MAG: putative Fe-S cluster assembly protein SufT [Deltaproteobacteria bacterium]|nr:putative Fe-S cluster assembly protein SufT [Deltaproteobacteria bacterium]
MNTTKSVKQSDRTIALFRECEAILIPTGERVRLPAGSRVRVTQSLGGSFTVMTDRGSVARISGRDADALGVQNPEMPPGPPPAHEDLSTVESLVWEKLKTCFDPEIPVNIVDLGLVYRCQVSALPDGGYRAEVRFTLTAPGCGMGDVLREDIRNQVAAVPGIREVDVEIVWEPPWDQSRISYEAKIELGIV